MIMLRRYLVLLGLMLTLPALAQQAVQTSSRFVADIELETEADLSKLLSRAGQLFLEGKVRQEDGAVVLVLHARYLIPC